jgi:hypothetical protein
MKRNKGGLKATRDNGSWNWTRECASTWTIKRSFGTTVSGRSSVVNNHERTLTDDALRRIEQNIYDGQYNDHEIMRLFETIRIQRTVLRALLNLFRNEPAGLISIADPIRRATLADYKFKVAMEGRD